MKFIGFDISLASTGVVALDDKEDKPLYEAVIVSNKELKEVYRIYKVAGEIFDAARTKHPCKVIIEGYAYSSKGRQAPKAELTGMLKYMLYTKGGVAFGDIWVIAPTTLKMFVLGKGNAPKSLMLKGVFQRYGYDTNSDDLADAYGLARLGRAISRHKEGYDVGLTKYEVKAIVSSIKQNP